MGLGNKSKRKKKKKQVKEKAKTITQISCLHDLRERQELGQAGSGQGSGAQGR